MTFSFDGGPWDSLDDPVITLSTLNQYEARTIHDEILCSLDPTSTTDFVQSANDAQQCWDDLRVLRSSEPLLGGCRASS